jgi:precorrin-6A synthase
MAEVDVFLVLDKPDERADLLALRDEVLRRHVPQGRYRVVTVPDAERDRTATAYVRAVDDWRDRRAQACAEAYRSHVGAAEVAAFLVWGDATLYDSTLAVVAAMRDRHGIDVDVEVVPGISSLSALAARHAVSMNQVGRPVQITTGRQLAADGGFPAGVDDLLVMLDARNAFRVVADDPDVTIYWGAYVGSPDELLVAGPVGDVADQIVAVREQARAAKGWIMDSYLLRRHRRDA